MKKLLVVAVLFAGVAQIKAGSVMYQYCPKGMVKQQLLGGKGYNCVWPKGKKALLGAPKYCYRNNVAYRVGGNLPNGGFQCNPVLLKASKRR